MLGLLSHFKNLQYVRQQLFHQAKVRSEQAFATEWGRFKAVETLFREAKDTFTPMERCCFPQRMQEKYGFRSREITPQEVAEFTSATLNGQYEFWSRTIKMLPTPVIGETRLITANHEFTHHLQNGLGLINPLDPFPKVYTKLRMAMFDFINEYTADTKQQWIQAIQETHPNLSSQISAEQMIYSKFMTDLMKNPKLLYQAYYRGVRLINNRLIPSIMSRVSPIFENLTLQELKEIKQGALIELQAYKLQNKYDHVSKEIMFDSSFHQEMIKAALKQVRHAERNHRFLQSGAAPAYHQWQGWLDTGIQQAFSAIQSNRSLSEDALFPILDMVMAPYQSHIKAQIAGMSRTDLKRLLWKLQHEKNNLLPQVRQGNFNSVLRNQAYIRIERLAENQLYPKVLLAVQQIDGLGRSANLEQITPKRIKSILAPTIEYILKPMTHGELKRLQNRFSYAPTSPVTVSAETNSKLSKHLNKQWQSVATAVSEYFNYGTSLKIRNRLGLTLSPKQIAQQESEVYSHVLAAFTDAIQERIHQIETPFVASSVAHSLT